MRHDIGSHSGSHTVADRIYNISKGIANKMDQKYYVYMLMNYTNTVIYIGVTNNLIRRVYEHKNKLVAGFTYKYNVNKLVYYEIFEDPENAISREKSLKNLLRYKKIDLIKNFNPTLKDLYTDLL